MLQELVRYYEMMAQQNKIARLGWCETKVSFALEISDAGELLGVIPTTEIVMQKSGKKEKQVERPQVMEVPKIPLRTVKAIASFLCDNSGYMLGIDGKGNAKRAKECFELAKQLHLNLLGELDSPAARAVCAFFQTWNPEHAAEHPELQEAMEKLMKGANLIFSYRGRYVHEDNAAISAWNREYQQSDVSEEDWGICLATGRRGEIAQLHGVIKGVRDAQAMGAILVSFNAPSFESYGMQGGENAPVSTYGAFAYTTALSSLLADPKHHAFVGDMTVVYWSEHADERYAETYKECTMGDFNDTLEENTDHWLHDVVSHICSGQAVNVEELGLSMGERFYVLGLAPNAARISVRFFYQDSFGNILKHIQEHYKRLEITRPSFDHFEHLGIKRLLDETVNQNSKDKKAMAAMAAGMYRAMLSGGRYPASVYHATLMRIRADQDDDDRFIHKITRGRMALIKAYLLRNGSQQEIKEALTVGINESCTNTGYVLGRLFCVLERIQEDANPGINSTIKDRYFNSACTTPGVVFSVLLKLKNNHMRKFSSEGTRIYYDKMVSDLMNMLPMDDRAGSPFPSRLTLEEQGTFMLGYYHQQQKMFTKKTKEEN